MTYHFLSDGMSEEAKRDFDLELSASPAAPKPARSRGTKALMTLIQGAG